MCRIENKQTTKTKKLSEWKHFWEAIWKDYAAILAGERLSTETKFTVYFEQDKVEAIVLNSAAAVADPGGVGSLWNAVKEKMFSLLEREKELGLGENCLLYTSDAADDC